MPTEITHRQKPVFSRIRDRCTETLEGVVDAISNRLLRFGIGAAAVKQAAMIQEKSTEAMTSAFETSIEATRHARSMATEGDDTEKALLEMFIGGVLAQSKTVTLMMQAGDEPNAEGTTTLERPTQSFASLPDRSANAGKQGDQAIKIEPTADPAIKIEPSVRPEKKTEPTSGPEQALPAQVKRRRGRPEGSKNKPKNPQPLD